MIFSPFTTKISPFFISNALILDFCSILSQDHVRFIDAQVTMNSAKNSARKALVALFNSLEPIGIASYLHVLSTLKVIE
jgi:hypothetical protein